MGNEEHSDRGGDKVNISSDCEQGLEVGQQLAREMVVAEAERLRRQQPSDPELLSLKLAAEQGWEVVYRLLEERLSGRLELYAQYVDKLNTFFEREGGVMGVLQLARAPEEHCPWILCCRGLQL